MPSEQILAASAKHPKPDTTFQYGTAGFRMKANLLDSVVFRVGLLASLRSRKLNGQTIGVMITASHNPPEDNGIKLVDPMGEMLEQSWESHATWLANSPDDKTVVERYHTIASELKINLENKANVIYARDTRASGSSLVASLVDALQSSGAVYTDYKLLTTPQLHYLVRCINTKGTQYEYGEVSEKGYYEKLADAFKRAIKGKTVSGAVTVDCANGVGGPKLREFLKYLPTAADGGIDIKVVNDDVLKPEALNMNCGADYVKTGQRAPPSSKASPGDRCCSLDGDADRIVYYFVNPKDNAFQLLDGDRIATLAASFLADLSRQAGLSEKLAVGVVQTAYANGASTHYITSDLKLPVVCTATGVKHLHHAATRFDIGVYFEANGHGTVLFSPKAVKQLTYAYEPQSPAQKTALDTLRALLDLINQAVGDALSDMLLVEVILAHKGWGMTEWTRTYVDLPNRLVRVEVRDRGMFKVVDAERQMEEPKNIQSQLNELVQKYKDGRSFARPSGTEDAMRVYAEAATRAEADQLATRVADLVKRFGA
ncbi:N-acetylglucosamine-phosphate mutase-like protein [Microthyrium microscopicum]|uniref:Phosphoacetylglucosamine mutase n=1 Tax=Microthyrium microscopicum TaxID=703497 RepID=A0A6A6TZL2_9PEZI|nr:N-acetylglucosamine-phosphate mutase-like protein [Microthyrium microscopicum]